jgi:hypothetical protein
MDTYTPAYPKPAQKRQRVHKHPPRNKVPTINDLCYECLQNGITTPYAAMHEVFYGTGYRQLSQRYKMQIRLCNFHHQDSKHGIHFNRDFDYRISKMYQQVFTEKHGTELFRQKFGDNMAAKELKYERSLYENPT